MDDLNKITPELSKLKKENPFRVPDSYFDDFSARLQMKIEAEKKAIPEPKNRIIQFLKPAISLAASFALIFMLVYWPLNNFLTKQEVADNSTEIGLYDDDYYAYLGGIDEYSLYAMMNEESEPEVSEEEYIDYLGAILSEYDIYELGTEF